MAREGEFRGAKDLQGREDQYVRICLDSFEVSRDTFAVSYKRYNRSYKLYRAWKLGKYTPYRANIAIPILFSLVQSDVAKKLDLLFGPGPLVNFKAGGPEDQVLARRRTALINVQLQDAETFDKSTRFLTSSSIFGTTAWKYFWDVRKELVEFRADLGTGEKAFSSEQLSFDGPNWQPVDVRNIFPEPGKVRIKEMTWIVERFFLDKEDVNRLAESGFYLKRGAADVEYSGHPGAKDEYLQGANPAVGDAGDEWRSPNHRRPIEILQWWGRVPRDLAIDGEVNLVITIANRHTLLRAEANPFNEIPFGEYSPMPDPWHWHSPSKVEVAEKLQVATNAMASQKVDILSLFADPQFFYNRRSAPPARKLFARPGAWHPFDGEVGPANIQAMIPDLRGVQNLYTELEQQAQWMEQGTGIVRDAIQGLAGPDRETARGFLGRQQSASVRLLMEARIAANQWIEPLSMKFVRLDRKFLTFPKAVRMLGASALIDPLMMRPIPQDLEMMGVNDMLPDYDAQAYSLMSSVSRGQQFQQLITLMQVAQSNPILIQLVNWMAFWRQLLILADVPNPDELMGTDGIVMQAVGNALAGALGGGGTAGATGAGGSPPALPAAGNVIPFPTGG